jgi:hypothetical protein
LADCIGPPFFCPFLIGRLVAWNAFQRQGNFDACEGDGLNLPPADFINLPAS